MQNFQIFLKQKKIAITNLITIIKVIIQIHQVMIKLKDLNQKIFLKNQI